MRIVFMGTPEYARRILQELIKAPDIDVVAVYTQPDKPVGRKQVLTPPPVKELALKNEIETLQPKSLKEKSVQEQLRSYRPAFIVVAAYGQILPKAILDIAPCINLHASLLPKYRGASPVQQTLLNGDSVTGVTSMLMDEGLDTGDILLKEEVKIEPTMRRMALLERLSDTAATLTLKTLRNFDEITPTPQDESRASNCKKITKRDGLVEFDDAAEIFNKYRAFEGWPGIFLASGLKLEEMSLIDETKAYPRGKILHIYKNGAIEVGCDKGLLLIGKVQPPGKKRMDAKSYLVGRGVVVGDSLL